MTEFASDADDFDAGPEDQGREEPAASDESVDRGGVAALVGLGFLLALAALVRWRRGAD